MRVLLAEDNAVNRLLAERQHARLGHSLDVVVSGEEAVAAALDLDVDVILMDRHLPDLDGLEATRRIRRAEQTVGGGRHVPIIAVTADARPGHREECLAAGMDDFLTKPLDLAQLADALERHRPSDSPDEPPPVAPDVAALTLLMATVGGDLLVVAEVIRTYLEELPGRRLAVQAAARRASARQLLAAAHSLHTSSATIGATGVADLCALVERAAENGDLAGAQRHVPNLLARCQQAEETLTPLTSAAAIADLLS